MAGYLPWMSHLLHLKPWDIERLTWRQFVAYRDWLIENADWLIGSGGVGNG